MDTLSTQQLSLITPMSTPNPRLLRREVRPTLGGEPVYQTVYFAEPESQGVSFHKFPELRKQAKKEAARRHLTIHTIVCTGKGKKHLEDHCHMDISKTLPTILDQ